MQRLKICVLGGSGFLGREICRLIVAMGHQAVSVSRSGRPAVAEPWAEGVEWIRADILNAAGALGDWSAALAGCAALIHAVGVGREDAPAGQSFARLHRDSVGVSARAAEQMGVSKFVFISATQRPPGTSADYLQSKIDGETMLQSIDIPTAILRPDFIHNGTARLFGSLTDLNLEPIDMVEESSNLSTLQNWVLDTPGLRLEKVAMAALRAALQPQTVGVLDPAAIDYLGDAMFIQ